ncbi:hypothetical protein GYMLUDRAFT_246137 [Collybiopsis luxurians FD-317 M1]|uniref:Uncharacterized protein n=1 Tax=Collybiopsis luxurians FD-317 M1 TaxID=944289 RepID=A0A0D0CJB7_9AGAR|nr:hypothetical protein GYMLUDRAFT_246137 [Collybiopsis luxurians FD-317 M1]
MQGNNPTYDAFCYQDWVGIAWQHTTAHDHPFSNKGFPDLNKWFKAAQDFFVLKLDVSDWNPTTDQIEELMGPEHEDGEVDSDIEDEDNEMDID